MKLQRFLRFSFLLLASLALFGANSLAGDTDRLFERLRNTGEKYDVAGTVCEQAAKLDFELKYPAPKYQVVTGIGYSRGGETLGELDVVVFDTLTHRVTVAKVNFKALQNL